jgi:outer membrane murein-binding lipoprotein Lpp
MFMRRRPLLRAAVVGGGAYVAGKHMANKANEQASNEAYQNQRIDQLEQQQPQYQDQQQYTPPPQQQAPPPDAAPAAGPSMADQLQQIAALHQQGVLSDDEFAAAKAKLLGS